MNLDLGTGALVLVDLFAVRLVSWGQTFLATESSDLFKNLPCEQNLSAKEGI